MTTSQIPSGGRQSTFDDVIESLPAALSPSVAPAACRLIARAEAMGLVGSDPATGATDFSVGRLDQALQGFAAIGIGRRELAPDVTFDLRGGLEMLMDEVENSPAPHTEWASMTAILGLETIAGLCGELHESTVRRYLKGQRATPDAVAQRLHFVAMVCADLLTGYNDFGVRRWFTRNRSALGGRAPRDLLAGPWSPDDDGPRQVADLASRLLTMSAS